MLRAELSAVLSAMLHALLIFILLQVLHGLLRQMWDFSVACNIEVLLACSVERSVVLLLVVQETATTGPDIERYWPEGK